MGKAKDYTASVTEIVKTPSGHDFVMQEPDIIAVAEFMAEVGIDMTDKDITEKLKKVTFAENLKASLIHLLPSACVDPKVALEPTDDDTIPLRRLTPTDQVFLVAWCTKKIAMNAEGFDERAFRQLLDVGAVSG